jgi:hypothetical protein
MEGAVKMHRRIICVIMAFVVLFAAVDCLYAARKKKSTIIIYNSGRHFKFTSKDSYFYKMRRRCEDLLRRADGSFEVRFDEKMISSIKKNDTAVEVIYSRPKRIILKFLDRERIRISRLIIPVTGRYAREDTATIIYWDSESIGPNQLINSEGVSEVSKLIDSMMMNL